MAPKSNIALLTEGQSYIRRAKKAREDQVEEIKFDDSARSVMKRKEGEVELALTFSEWLTGFSKRKKAKIEGKRERAKEREKQEHLDARRKARQELKERARQNVKNVRTAMGLNNSDDEDDDSSSDEENAEAGPSKVIENVEFEDEDQLATVTIMDDFDPAAMAIPTRVRGSNSPEPLAIESIKPKVKLPEIGASSKRAMQKAKREKEAKKEEKRSRSMETKAERKFGRAMDAKRRAKKSTIALERDGKTRGKAAASRGRGGGGRGGKRGGKR